MKSGISPERSARNGAELPQHLAKSNLSEAKPPMSQQKKSYKALSKPVTQPVNFEFATTKRNDVRNSSKNNQSDTNLIESSRTSITKMQINPLIPK